MNLACRHNSSMPKQDKMPLAVAEVKKRAFASIVLDPGNKKTREEICEELGITTSQYDDWSSDKNLWLWGGAEVWRMQEQARLLLQRHQVTAVETLVDVMRTSNNDLARVRAAEGIMEKQPYHSSHADQENAEAVAKLLSSRSPTFHIENISVTNVHQRESEPILVDAEIIDD